MKRDEEKKHIEVVAGVIKSNEKILCVQRGPSKYEYISHKYEFPGGKIEKGETKEEALHREIVEELNMAVRIKEEVVTVKHEYPDFFLTMFVYMCECSSEQLTLKEHINFKWLEPSKLNILDWAAADIPVVNLISKRENDIN